MANPCDCEVCQPLNLLRPRMILCAICGNKRCPHATDHQNACTNSNEPGQPGSTYVTVREPQDQPHPHVTPVGGNVFADLGFPHDEAARLLARARTLRSLYMELEGVIWDVEHGAGFDAVCLNTIKRVQRELIAQEPEPENRYPANARAWSDEQGCTHIDWCLDPQRQMSIMVTNDGRVVWAIYLNGERLNGNDVDEPEFRQAVYRWAQQTPNNLAPDLSEQAIATIRNQVNQDDYVPTRSLIPSDIPPKHGKLAEWFKALVLKISKG